MEKLCYFFHIFHKVSLFLGKNYIYKYERNGKCPFWLLKYTLGLRTSQMHPWAARQENKNWAVGALVEFPIEKGFSIDTGESIIRYIWVPDPMDCYRIHLSFWIQIRIWNQCCGSGMFIPDPDIYPSRISDPGSKNGNKTEGWKKICYHTFLCSYKFHNWKLF